MGSDLINLQLRYVGSGWVASSRVEKYRDRLSRAKVSGQIGPRQPGSNVFQVIVTPIIASQLANEYLSKRIVFERHYSSYGFPLPDAIFT